MTRIRPLVAVAAAVLIFAACGGTDQTSTETGDSPAPAAPGAAADPATPDAPTADAPPGESGPPSQPAAPADVPDVEVASIPSGDAVNLQTLAQDNDTLFWFWAPH